MAYAYVQSSNPGTGSLNTYTLAVAANAAGALLVLAASYASQNRSISSVSDNVDGAWTLGDAKVLSGSNLGGYYLKNASASSIRVVTVVFDANTVSGVLLDVDEYSGITSTNPLDVHAAAEVAGSSGSTLTTPSITTTQSGELLWSCAFSFNAGRPVVTPSSPVAYAGRSSLSSAQMRTADARQSAAGSTNVTWTVSGGNADFAAIQLCFKETLTASVGRFFFGM